MTFTEIEKKVLISILTKHISEIQHIQDMAGQNLGEFTTEEEYTQLLQNIVKKLQ